MADNNQQVIVDIQLNADSSQVQGVNDSLNETKKKIQEINDSPVETKSYKNLKQALREATNEALRLQQAGQQNTQEYRNVAAAIAQLRDEQQTLQRTVSAFDPGNSFASLVGVAKAGTQAIQGYTAAMALFGEQSEEAAETIKKLEGISAIVSSLDGLGDAQDYFRGLIGVIKGATAATETQTAATRTLNLALKGLGLGLIIAAVAYLISNFDDLKDSVLEALPFLKGTGDVIDKLKAGFIAVGGAVVQFLIAPIKALVHLIKGEFKQAAADIANGANVIANTQGAYDDQRKKQAAEKEMEIAKERAKALEYTLKLQKEGSQAYKDTEAELYRTRLASVKKGSEDETKIIQERNIKIAQEQYKAQNEAEKKAKEAADKALAKSKEAHEKLIAENKAYIDKIKQLDADANKIIANSQLTAKEVELKTVQDKYAEQIKVYEQKGFSINKLVEAQRIEEAAINKKYDEGITGYLKSVQSKTLDTYAQSIADVNKQIDDLISTATPKQKELLEASRKAQIDFINESKYLASKNNKANIDVTTTETNLQTYQGSDPQTVYDLTKANLDAQLSAMQANYELEQQAAQGNKDKLLEIDANYQNSLAKNYADSVAAQTDLDNALKETKLNNLDAVSSASSALSALAGENTIIGKALGVASATIDTYVGASKALAQGGIFGIATGAAVIAAGLLNVKKILSVKVPSISGSAGGGSSAASSSVMASASAPVVNAAALNSNSNQVQDVRVINPEGGRIEAVVTDKSLRKNEDRRAAYYSLSRF